jgi:hypothetical protein
VQDQAFRELVLKRDAATLTAGRSSRVRGQQVQAPPLGRVKAHSRRDAEHANFAEFRSAGSRKRGQIPVAFRG